jgi:hypothetical protein
MQLRYLTVVLVGDACERVQAELVEVVQV